MFGTGLSLSRNWLHKNKVIHLDISQKLCIIDKNRPIMNNK